MGRHNGAYRVSVGKPDGKGLREKPMQRGEDNVKLDFHDIGEEPMGTGARLL